MDILISIIVPVYNSEKTLDRCISSLVKQSIDNIEIILIDDGSNDASGQICDKFASLHSNIFVYHRTNKGVSASRNFGISVSKGDYIGFVDSDDYVMPEMYETLYNDINKHEADFSFVNHLTENNNNQINVSRFYKGLIRLEKKSFSLINFGEFFSVCGIYKKNIIKDNNILFPEDLRYCEDMCFLIEYFYCCTKAYFSTKHLYIVDISNSNSLSSWPKYVDKYILRSNDYINKLKKLFNSNNDFEEKNFLCLNYYSFLFGVICVYLANDEICRINNRKQEISKLLSWSYPKYSSLAFRFLPLHRKFMYWLISKKFIFLIIIFSKLIYILRYKKLSSN